MGTPALYPAGYLAHVADVAHTGRMGRVTNYSRQIAVRDFGRAEDAGHVFSEFIRANQGCSIARCSCGWEATPRRRKVAVAAAAYWHVLEVCRALDERKKLETVEWSDAPSSPALRHGVAATQERHADAARSLHASVTPSPES